MFPVRCRFCCPFSRSLSCTVISPRLAPPFVAARSSPLAPSHAPGDHALCQIAAARLPLAPCTLRSNPLSSPAWPGTTGTRTTRSREQRDAVTRRKLMMRPGSRPQARWRDSRCRWRSEVPAVDVHFRRPCPLQLSVALYTSRGSSEKIPTKFGRKVYRKVPLSDVSMVNGATCPVRQGWVDFGPG